MPFELNFDTIIKVAAPLLVALIGGVGKRVIEGRPRLIMYLVHASEHPLPNPVGANQVEGPVAQHEQNQQPDHPPSPAVNLAHSHAIVVKNTGKRSAFNVRIDHQIFPFSYRVMPPLNHKVTYSEQDLSAEICIPVLVPGEQVTISYLYFPPLTWHRINAYVKSDEGMAKVIQTIPTAPPPRLVVWLIWVLMFIGASTAAYWLLKLLPVVLR
jgi:hypothetical protein